MPFSTNFRTYPVVEYARRVRQHKIATFGLAVLLVALATLARWALGDIGVEAPFITFYSAIIVATLLGGLWPGIAAIILSSLAAWRLFLPPAHSWNLGNREQVELLLFILISGTNVIVVALLNALVDRVIAQQENMRILIESTPSGIVVVNEQGEIKLVNASVEKLFGYTRLELLGRKIEVLVPDRQSDAHRAERGTFGKKPETRLMGVGRDLSARRKNGTEFPVEIGLNPISRNSVLATVIDISERKRAQQSQQLIIRELQHRTQNLFAVFQSIANRTVDESRTAAEIKYVLNGRLMALSRAYTILANAGWEGVSLTELIDRQFAGFSKRVKVSQCDIILSPSAAQQFAMIIHELATNSLKYGSLSDPDGHVLIEGRIERLNGGGHFSFLWTERGGPPVALPTRKGFGSVILIDSAQQFGESVRMDYARDGLVYEFKVRLSAAEGSKNLAGQVSGTTFSSPRAGSV